MIFFNMISAGSLVPYNIHGNRIIIIVFPHVGTRIYTAKINNEYTIL